MLALSIVCAIVNSKYQSNPPIFRLGDYELKFLLEYSRLDCTDLETMTLQRNEPQLLLIYDTVGVPGWQTSTPNQKMKWVRQLLKKNDAQFFIQELQRNWIRQQAESRDITPKKVLDEINNLAFSDLSDCLALTVVLPGEGSNITEETLYKLHVKPLTEWNQSNRAALKKIVVRSNGDVAIEMHDKLKALHILANHLGIFNNFYNAVSVLAQHGINIAPDPHNPNQWQVINGSRLDEPPPQKINGFREPKPEPPERENAIFDLPINQ